MFWNFRKDLILRPTSRRNAHIYRVFVIVFHSLQASGDLAHLIRPKQSIRRQRLQEQFILSYIALLDDGPDPIFTVRGLLNRLAFAIGLVPVMTVETVQSDA